MQVYPIRHFGNTGISAAQPAHPVNERVEWIICMNTVLYFSPSGVAYETQAYTTADIAELVSDYGLESLTSTDRQFDFWFTRSTQRCQRRPNRAAIKLLLATTNFTAKTVPLLRGCVVVATHDSDGDLDGLSWEQLELLVQRNRALTKRDERVLDRKIAQDERRQQRHARRLRRGAHVGSVGNDVDLVRGHRNAQRT
jgi:hypothetical protein